MPNTNIYTIYDEDDFSFRLSPEQMNEWTEEDLESLTTCANVGENNPMYGDKWTEERIDKQSGKNNSMYGVRKFGEDNPNYGNKWTEEYTRKMRILHKGEGNPNYGNTYSEETKRLLSIKAKNRERGTCRYCDKEMDISNLGRWHNDKCKYK